MNYGGAPAPPLSQRGPRVPRFLAPVREPISARRCRPVLKSISQSGERANRNAEQAERETDRLLNECGSVTSLDQALSAGPRKPAGAGDIPLFQGDVTSMVQEFSHLVAGIETLLSGGVQSHGPTKTLKEEGGLSTEKVALHEQMHYRVALPNRPTQVVVTINTLAGAEPCIWGSTVCDKPHAKNYEFRGKGRSENWNQQVTGGMRTSKMGTTSKSQDRILHLVYDHIILGDEAADTDNIVPKCRDLFVSVEGEMGQAMYSIAVSFRLLKGAASKKRDAAKESGWQKRVRELQGDLAKLETFKEHVQHLQEIRSARRHSGADIVERNAKAAVAEHSPNQRLARLQMESLKRAANQEAVQSRRHMIDNEKVQAHVGWLSRCDERKRVREEEEAKRRRDMLAAKLEEERLAKKLEAQRLKELEEEKAERKRMHQLMSACRIIQKYIVRKISTKRCRNLFHNVVCFRQGLALFARMMQPLVVTRSVCVARNFLQTQLEHGDDSPNIVNTLKRFRRHVIMVQRFWRRQTMVKKAYVEMLMAHWPTAENVAVDAFMREETQKHAAAAEVTAAAKAHMEKLAVVDKKKGAAKEPAAAAPQRSYKPKTSVVATIDREMFIPPRFIVTQNLEEYVIRMFKSYTERVHQWTEDFEKRREEKDLASFGFQDEGVVTTKKEAAKPLRVYLDINELTGVVYETIKKYRSGHYKGLLMSRRRVMKKHYAIWERYFRRRKMGLGKSPDGRKRSSTVGAVARESNAQATAERHEEHEMASRAGSKGGRSSLGSPTAEMEKEP